MSEAISELGKIRDYLQTRISVWEAQGMWSDTARELRWACAGVKERIRELDGSVTFHAPPSGQDAK